MYHGRAFTVMVLRQKSYRDNKYRFIPISFSCVKIVIYKALRLLCAKCYDCYLHGLTKYYSPIIAANTSSGIGCRRFSLSKHTISISPITAGFVALARHTS